MILYQKERNAMYRLMIGYPVMVLACLAFRVFYHIFHKKNPNVIQAMKNDVMNLYASAKRVISSEPKTVKTIVVILAVLFVWPMIPVQSEFVENVEYALSVLLCFLLAIVFVPQEDPSSEGFPFEIFGFVYSVIIMFYSEGSLVFGAFYTNDFLKEDMWMYGYGITVISYVICIATLRRFMERKLSKENIVLLGMIMLTALEFITYYGVGFFGGLQWYNPQAFESNIFGDITSIMNQGIFISSQSQILERDPVEIWGYIILNGTDVLTITAVLGYVVQKFMESK